MSFKRVRNGRLYLYWNEKVWDAEKQKYIWRQRAKAISDDVGTFKQFKDKFDYSRNRRRLGLTNDRMEWPDFKAEFLATTKGKTRTVYEYAFRRFEDIAHPHRIADLNYNHAMAYRRALDTYTYTKGKSPTPKPITNTTKNIDIRCLHAAWAEAVRLGYAETNIFDDVKPFPITKRIRRYLPREDIQKLIEAARASENPSLYPMCIVLKYTGVRLGELINLRWGSFDLDRGRMFILGSDGWEPKDREEGAIGLHPEVVTALREWRETAPGGPESYVFPGQGGKRRSPDALAMVFNRLYRRAGVQASGLHVWRHSFGTHADIPEKVKQKIMRHSDPRTTRGYEHVTPEEMDAVKRMDY